jgi:retron-type reverse transcriptase
LAEVCSYKGSLPTGAPTSPVLANIILTPLDKSLLSVCNQYGISYSRYADDLTFSGSSDVKKIIPFVKKCLGGFGLEIESKKLNLYRRGRRQIVTGIVVNDKVNLPRKIRRKLRAAVHSSSIGKQTKWHGKPMNVGELKGHLSYLQSVNPDEAMRLKQILAEGVE